MAARPIIRICTTGKELSSDLERSLVELGVHGRDWVAEVARARRVTGLATARLVHPDELPDEQELWVTHNG